MRFGLFLAGLLCCGAARGQYSETVFQSVFVATSTTGVSTAVRNIGAQYQQITAFLSDGSGGPGACKGVAAGGDNVVNGWDVHIEGSTNGSVWFSIGPRITTIPNPGGAAYSSTPYTGPYIRVNFATTPSTAAGCLLTVLYAGTLNGTASSSAPNTALDDGFLTSTFALANGDNDNLTGCTVGRPAVYSLSVANTTAGALALTLYLKDTGKTTLGTYQIPSHDTRIWPTGPRAYWYTSPAAVLNGVAATASFGLTAGAAGMNVDFVYRCE